MGPSTSSMLDACHNPRGIQVSNTYSQYERCRLHAKKKLLLGYRLSSTIDLQWISWHLHYKHVRLQSSLHSLIYYCNTVVLTPQLSSIQTYHVLILDCVNNDWAWRAFTKVNVFYTPCHVAKQTTRPDLGWLSAIVRWIYAYTWPKCQRGIILWITKPVLCLFVVSSTP